MECHLLDTPCFCQTLACRRQVWEVHLTYSIWMFFKSRCPPTRSFDTLETSYLLIGDSRHQLAIKPTMPGRIDTRWSPWPQLTLATAKGVQPGTEEYTKALLSTYGAEALKTSWIQVCKRLESITDKITSQGNSVIPQLGLEDFLTADEGTKDKLKDIGCFIVRQVVSEQQATEWYHELKEYVGDNKAQVTGLYLVCVFYTSHLTSSRTVQACQPRAHSCSTSTIRQSSKQHALIQTAWPSRELSIVYGRMRVTNNRSSTNLSPTPMASVFDPKIQSSTPYLHISVSVSSEIINRRC
jgi:hypothetical protein